MDAIFKELNNCLTQHIDAVVVTVVDKKGTAPCNIGDKMLVNSKQDCFGTIGGGALELFAQNRVVQVLKDRSSMNEKYILSNDNTSFEKDEIVLDMACGGRVTLFYEFIGPKQYVYIFGAGHCGSSLASLLSKIDFKVILIDNREDLLSKIDDETIIKVCTNYDDYILNNNIVNDRYVVIATPSHEYDYQILDLIIQKNIKPAYFGMLCSKKKILDYLHSIQKKTAQQIDLSNFYSPIGLDLGGTTPNEIALSISSEIVSHFYKKDRINHLREKLNDTNLYWK